MAAIDLDPDVEALLRGSAPRRAQPLAGRERIAEVVFAVGLVAAVIALQALFPDRPRAGDLTLAIALVPAYAAARRMQFSVGAGGTAPVELVLVPMLLLLDPAAVPLLVAAGMAIARLPEYVRGEVHPDRILLQVSDAWYTLAPAALIAAFGHAHPDLAQWPLYLAVLASQFALDAVSGMGREWLASGTAPRLQLELMGIVFAVDAALAPIGLMAALLADDTPAALLLAMPLLWLLVVLRNERERRIEGTLALSEAYRGTAILMGEMLEADDAYTGGEHSRGVVALAIATGREVGLTGREQRNLEFGALLHDIGKLLTPNEILNKPGKLTDEEWAVIRRHPEDGQRMLDRIGGVLAEVGLTVRGHHERWDGGGYPDGLAGEAIPLAARIIGVCDAVNAMTTNRSYRRAMPMDTAIAELRRCSGSQFDPAVVDAVCAVVERERQRAFVAPLAA